MQNAGKKNISVTEMDLIHPIYSRDQMTRGYADPNQSIIGL
jgi:hypothetical protein